MGETGGQKKYKKTIQSGKKTKHKSALLLRTPYVLHTSRCQLIVCQNNSHLKGFEILFTINTRAAGIINYADNGKCIILGIIESHHDQNMIQNPSEAVHNATHKT